MWIIDIPRPVPSANSRYVNGRDPVSRALYRKLRNAWAVDLRITALQAGMSRAFVTATHRPARRIVLTRIMGPRQRAYDYDGLVGGCKPIIDAMKPDQPARFGTIKTGPNKGKEKFTRPVFGAALIVDDSPAWVVVEYRQEKGPTTGCRIQLEDVESLAVCKARHT